MLNRLQVPLMILAVVALAAATWAGLVRLGWHWPALGPALPRFHGPLMVSGFLGTLISLERAVALERRWTFLAPLLSGLGGVLLIVGVSGWPGPLLITLGSLGLMATFGLVLRRQPALFTSTMALGTLAWLVGNGLWLLGRPIHRVVLWWAGFLVLTIVGERLELSRLLQLSQRSHRLFLLALGLFVTGLVVTEVDLSAGTRWTGAGMLALAVWLLRYDVARRTLHQSGLPRFIAVCLLSGYVWLGVSGGLALRFGALVAGPRYDAMLHALFLGFVFAMIFGHAPVIFPALLGLPIHFRPIFYAHLVLLHVTLLLRLVGDLAGWSPGRLWGGLLNGVVLLLFLVNSAYSALGSTAEAATTEVGQKGVV
jgi:hypothetical protein